jgi:hypothetical protein
MGMKTKRLMFCAGISLTLALSLGKREKSHTKRQKDDLRFIICLRGFSFKTPHPLEEIPYTGKQSNTVLYRFNQSIGT